MVGVSEAAATVTLAVVAAVVRSWHTGKIRAVLDDRQTREGRLDEIHEATQETADAVDDINNTLETVSEVMYELHKDDEEVSGDALAEELNVDDVSRNIHRSES